LRRILLPVGNLKERRMGDDPNAREEGFYWVVLGQNPPEIAYWERGEWWLAGDAKPCSPMRPTCSATNWCSGRG
jgi:hypothetical protein